MVKKQLIAQVGVFLLLGLNVAAYWFLWPNYHSVSSNEGKTQTQEKGTARLVPEAVPKEIAPAILKDAVPLSIPISAPQLETKSSSEQETISKLFEQIKKDSVVPMPPVSVPAPVPPAFPGIDAKRDIIIGSPSSEKLPEAPKLLPTIPSEPLHGDITPPVASPIAVASALTPKMLPSPWLLNMEMVGTRTQLFAKVRRPGTANIVAEFKIVCDRVEMKAPGGELQALGKVNIVGGGLNATCQRLILPIHETRFTLEDQAQIHYEGIAGSVLRGDRIIWELPASAAPIVPNLLPRPVLGVPK